MIQDLLTIGRLSDAVRARIAEADIVITGPTGWIGSAFIAFLHAIMGERIAQRVSLFGSRTLVLSPAMAGLHVRPLSEMRAEDVDGKILIHLAYLTKDKLVMMSAADYASRNLEIDRIALSAVKEASPSGVFVASSGAARDAANGEARDLYSMLKLVQEDTFQDAVSARAVPILVGRIFNISGPFGNKPELYALSNFILQAWHQAKIHISAPHLVFRSFVDVMDLVAVVLASLVERRGAPRAFDIAGAHVLEMRDLAEVVADTTGIPYSAITRAPCDPGRTTAYVGSPLPFAALAAQSGVRLSGIGPQVAVQAASLRSAPPLSS